MTRRISSFGRMALTWSWLALVAGIVAAVLVAIAGPLYSHDVTTLGAAFNLIRHGAWVGLGAAAAGLIGVIATLVARRYFTVVVALVALALGLASFLWPYMLLREARAAPPIHTVATDPAHPPRFIALAPVRRAAPNGLEYGGGGERMAKREVAALARFFASPAGRASPGHGTAVRACRTWGPACLAAVQRAYYPKIQPYRAPQATPAEAYAAALATAKAMGWEIAAADAATGHIEATATTAWFGFKDDIAIDVTASGSGSVVNVLSESRLGLSDVGQNAERVLAYLARLDRRLTQSQS